MDFNFLDQPNQHLPLQIPYGMPPSTNSQASAYHEMPLESPTVDLVYPVTISSTGAEYPPRPIALPQAVPPDRTAVFSTRIDLVNAGNLQVTQSSNSGVSQQVPQRGHSFHIPAFATTTHPDLNLTNTIRTATQCNSATGHRVEVPNIEVLSKPGPRPERDVHPNNCPPRLEREVDNSSSLQNKGQVQSTGRTESSCNKTAVKRLAPSSQPLDDASKDHVGDSQPHLHNSALATSILMEGGVLPEGLAYKQFDNDIKCVGVIAEKAIKKGTRYGPFKGDIKKGDFSENGHSNRQTWELCIDGAVVAYIGPMYSKKEWLGIIRYARCLEEWNVEADQFYGRIYFTAKADIQPGTELRVFYSDEYRENCGLQFGLADLQFSNKTEDFGCFWCDGRYSCPKSVSRHMKFIHNEKKSKDKIPPIVLPDKEAEMIKQITWGDRKGRKSNFRAATVETKARAASENPAGVSSKKTLAVAHLKQTLPVAHSKQTLPVVHSKQTLPMAHSKQTLPMETPTVPRIAASEELDDEQRFICTTCGKHFPSHGRLLMHESFHNDDDDPPSSDQCHICGFYFPEFNQLEAHLEKHKTSPFWCDECGKLYMQRSKVYRHKREKHNMNFYIRNRSTVFRKGTANPVRPPSPSGKCVLKGNRQCRVCRYVASSLSEHEDHSAKHDRYPAGCNICGNVYMAMRQVYRHKREKHGFPKLLYQPPLKVNLAVSLPGYAKLSGDVCLKCGFQCTDNADLADHVARHLTHPYGCSYCGNVYVQRKNLVRHKGEKHGHIQTENTESLEYPGRVTVDEDKEEGAPYACNRCEKRYSYKKGLYRHIREKHSAAYRPMPRIARLKMNSGCFSEREPHAAAVRPFHHTLSVSQSQIVSKMGNSEKTVAPPLPSTRKVIKKIGKNCGKPAQNHSSEGAPMEEFHGKRCSDTSNLLQHTLKHSSLSILSKKSAKTFPNRSAFRKHCKRPLWQRHFKCWLCQQWFPCVSQLKAHKQQSHSLKGKLFTCQLCRKAFTSGKSLAMHQHRHHKKKKKHGGDSKTDSRTEPGVVLDSGSVTNTPERALPPT